MHKDSDALSSPRLKSGASSAQTVVRYVLGDTDLIAAYTNGNYDVSMFVDGTKIRITDANSFKPQFPESIDLKITDRCDRGCAFCHEDSSPQGANASINHDFLYSLRGGTELAIGGGNPLVHPHLEDLLLFCRHRDIIANITVNQDHFFDTTNGHPRIFDWMTRNLVHGVGISLGDNPAKLDKIFKIERNNSLISKYSLFRDNCVIHVVAGVHSFHQVMLLANKGYKILILGYKQLRRAEEHYILNEKTIISNIKTMAENLSVLIDSFTVVSFDNLAVKQLKPERLFSKKEWQKIYMGDDGQFTMYIDMVKREFAKSSTSNRRIALLPSIDQMFEIVNQKI